MRAGAVQRAASNYESRAANRAQKLKTSRLVVRCGNGAMCFGFVAVGRSSVEMFCAGCRALGAYANVDDVEFNSRPRPVGSAGGRKEIPNFRKREQTDDIMRGE